MKRIFSVLRLLFTGSIFAVVTIACTAPDEIPNPNADRHKIDERYAPGAATRVAVYAASDLIAGYNRLFVTLYDSLSGAIVTDATVKLYPEMEMTAMKHSCPTEQPVLDPASGTFNGAAMFTMPSGNMGHWSLQVTIERFQGAQQGTAVLDLTIQETSPARVLSFLEDSGRRYYLASHFPDGMKIGVNDFELIAFTFESGTYRPLQNLAIELDPEMPSMDHGSPNNVHPVFTGAGHYLGKVNFTMSGEWRINLAISDESTPLVNRYFDVIVE